ncbi:MAG: queuosine precursor transporter [Myxococcaceae bacterium]|nr:queuosine precursor transporter [Myxococcaceae bacterium]
MNFDARTKLFVALSASFIGALVVGDIIGVKLVELTVADFPFIISVGMVPFPITFLLTDLLNEFYGAKAARFVTWVGLGVAAGTFIVINVVLLMPFAGFTEDPGWTGVRAATFNNVFGGSTRILLASMVAYVVAQFTDIAVFHAIKRVTQNRLLFLRATGSTVVSQLIDTVVIQTLAWVGTMPVAKIASIVVTSYVVKFFIALALTPAIYAGHALVERGLKIEPVKVPATSET